MATDLAKLVVSLEAETARYQQELDKARKQLGKFEKESRDAVVKVAQAAGAAAVAAATGFVVMTKAAIDAADNASKFAQQVGISTEALSQFSYAAGLSGATTEEFEKALVKLNKSAVDAAGGTAAQAEAFAALGVSVKGADGQIRDTESLLLDLTDAFSRMEAGPRKTALAIDLFGKSGAKLIPFLNSGREGMAAMRAEADALGVTIDSNAAKAAERFNDNLTRLQTLLQGAANQAANNLLPVLDEMSAALVEFGKNSGAAGVIVDGLRVAFETVVVLGANVAYVLTGIGRELGGLAAQAAAVATLDFGRAAEIGRLMREDAAGARKEIDAFSERILGANAAAEKVRGTMAKWSAAIAAAKSGNLEQQRAVMVGLAEAYRNAEFGAVGSAAAIQAYQNAVDAALPTIRGKSAALVEVSDAAKGAAKRLQSLVEALQLEAATMGMSAGAVELHKLQLAGATAAQMNFARAVIQAREAFDAQAAALSEGKALTEGLRTPLEAFDAELGRLNDLLQRGAIDWETYSRAVIKAQDAFNAADPKMQAAAANAARLNAMLEATPTAKLEETRADMLLLADAYDANVRAGMSAADAGAQFAEAAQTRLGTLPDATKSATDQMSVYADQAARNMQSAFADFLISPTEEGLEGLGSAFAGVLARMAAEAASAQIFEALGMGGKGGGGGGGAAIAEFFSGFFADGGVMRPGKAAIVGERGPELVLPSTSMRVLSAPDTADALSGGGRRVNQVFNITTPNPDAFRASERQIKRGFREGLK